MGISGGYLSTVLYVQLSHLKDNILTGSPWSERVLPVSLDRIYPRKNMVPVPYCIQVTPPIESHYFPCRSKSSEAIEIANRFRKLFGLEPIKAHAAIEHHSALNHSKFVPPFESTPLPPVSNDGKMDLMPFSPIPTEYVANASAQPVHRHSHHCLQYASFMERLSHTLMMLGPWEGRAITFVLGK